MESPFRRSRVFVVLSAFAVLSLFSKLPARAQEAPALTLPGVSAEVAAQAREDFAGADLQGKDGPMAKVGFDLALLFREHEAYEQGGRVGAFTPGNRLLQVRDERVVIDAVAAGEASALRADLEALGLEGAAQYGPVVSGRLPITALPQAAALGTLRTARYAAARALGAPGAGSARAPRIGATDTQGDVAQRSDAARASFGIDGAGVTVGVLSDSYDQLGGAAADVASGDLPAGVSVLDDTGSCAPDPACADEGRAMMQVVADVAPGAALAFHTALGGQAGHAAGIDALVAAGADVLVDDVAGLTEPMFQDGVVAQAVDAAVAAGAAFFSAAGNEGRDGYEANYTPGNDPIFGLPAHEFGGGDFFQNLTIPEGTGITVAFQWDQPYASATGGAGASTDLDIFLYDDPPSGALTGGIDANVGGDPVETFTFFNPVGSGETSFNLFINRFSGPNPTFVKYVIFDFEGTVNEFTTDSGTLFGHANADGAEAVGAAAYDQTPAFGVDPPVLESFSSAGTTTILFDLNDNPVNEVRQKPEVVAPDEGNNTFFGIDTDADTFPNFTGTSAAAAHAAAAAALLLDFNPTLTPSALYAALEGAALDMGAAGFDDDSGFGFLQVDAALGDPPPDLTVSVVAVGGPIVMPPEGGRFDYTIDITNSSAVDQTIELWINVAGPNNISITRGPVPMTIAAGTTFSRTIEQKVPDTAPAGTYTTTASIGSFPIADQSDSFTWEKQAASARR